MSFGLSDLAKKAGIGGSTLDVIQELEKHPEYALAGPLAGAGAAAANLLNPGMSMRTPLGSLGGRLFGRAPPRRGRGRVHPPALPGQLGKSVSPNLADLMAAMEATGRTVEGLQPWHVSGYVSVASGSVIAASADISDMFATAQTRAFTAADTFPWTFLCRRFRCALMTQPTAAAVEDGAWTRQLSLRFAVATEVGRISLDALSVERIIESPLSGSGGGSSSQQFPNPGVSFPVIFEKNGTYQMFLRTDFGITLTNALAFSYQMDGWVVQNVSSLSEEAIQSALANLIN